MKHNKDLWLLRIVTLVSLAIAVLSLLFFPDKVNELMGIRQEAQVDYDTVYVGIFLAVFIGTHRSIGKIVRRIKR